MEMKYLVEQDTGNIYLPAVHVTGIVGLDSSGTAEAKVVSKTYTNDTDKINMDLEFAEFDKVVYASLEVNFTHTDTEDASTAYGALLTGSPYQIDIDNSDLSSVVPMIFNCVAYDESGVLSGKIEVYAKYTNGLLTLQAALTERTYSVEEGIVTQYTLPLNVSKIVGTANSIVIGGGN